MGEMGGNQADGERRGAGTDGRQDVPTAMAT